MMLGLGDMVSGCYCSCGGINVMCVCVKCYIICTLPVLLYMRDIKFQLWLGDQIS